MIQPAPLSIAIAGAGLLGRLLAWRLALAGHRVTLCEQGSLTHPIAAAHTAAAMISPLSEVAVSDRSIYEQGLKSLSLWQEWVTQLNGTATEAISFSATGSLAIAHPQDLPELYQFYNDISAQLGTDNTAQWLNRADIAALEPGLSAQFQQGLYLPQEGHIDNRVLLPQLLQAAQTLGVDCRSHTAITFHPEPQCALLPLQAFNWVIDCRGMGAQQSQPLLRGVRGEVLWVHTPEVHLTRPIRLMHPRYKLYIVPKPHNRFIIGATEIESEDRSPISVQSLMELTSALYTLNPAFAEARILELDANLRPAYLNNLPQITCRTSALGPAVLTLNGLYRHGYLIAPALVEQALQQLSAPTHPCASN